MFCVCLIKTVPLYFDIAVVHELVRFNCTYITQPTGKKQNNANHFRKLFFQLIKDIVDQGIHLKNKKSTNNQAKQLILFSS